MRKQVPKGPAPSAGRGRKRDVAEFMHLMGLDDERRLACLRSLSLPGQAPHQRHVQYSARFTADST